MIREAFTTFRNILNTLSAAQKKRLLLRLTSLSKTFMKIAWYTVIFTTATKTSFYYTDMLNSP